MREIEVLARLNDDLDTAKKVLKNFEYKGSKRTIDTYYFDEKRHNLKPNTKGKLMECCRLRQKGEKFYITYKIDNYNDEIWVYSDEYEAEISSLTEMEKIFDCLGLSKLVVVDNTKHTYETPTYEIVLEEVKELGNFIEVEALYNDETLSPEVIKNDIYKFINELGLNIGEELNSGKPELLLNKNNSLKG